MANSNQSGIGKKILRFGLGIVGALVLTTMGLGIWIFSGATGGAKILAWQAPAPSARDLKSILKRKGVLEHIPLATGRVLMDKRVILNMSAPGASSFVDDGTPVIVYAHLLRHPTHGDVLIDSGLDSAFRKSPLGNVRYPGRLWLFASGIRFAQEPGRDIASRLRALSARPRKLFLTHLHVDHTAGIPELPASTRVFVGPGEIGDFFNRVDNGHLRKLREIYEIDFKSAVDLAPLGETLDVFGDGSLWAVHTPGHTNGHLSFLALTRAGPVLFTGDACHLEWGWKNGVGPMGITAKRNDQGQKSLNRLRKFSRLHPEARIWFGHQPPAKKRARAGISIRKSDGAAANQSRIFSRLYSPWNRPRL